MRPRFALIVALLALWVATVRTSTPIAVRVLTYNIHHGEGTDGQFDLARTAAIINSAQADLVALQEVDRHTRRSGRVDQLAELERLTGSTGVFGKAMDFQDGTYGVAVLTRKPILRSVTRPLPVTPDREPRTSLTVDVPMRDGVHLQFTTTHLDQGRDPVNRLAQASFLNDVLASTADAPAILAGDLNSRPDTDVMALLERRWANLFPFPVPSAPPAAPRGLVDHVLARPAGHWRAVEAQAIDDRLASDHRPLLVVLEWEPAR